MHLKNRALCRERVNGCEWAGIWGNGGGIMEKIGKLPEKQEMRVREEANT